MKQSKGFPETLEIEVGQMVWLQTDEGRERGRVSCLRPYRKKNYLIVKVTEKRSYIVERERVELI